MGGPAVRIWRTEEGEVVAEDVLEVDELRSRDDGDKDPPGPRFRKGKVLPFEVIKGAADRAEARSRERDRDKDGEDPKP